ARGRGRGRRGGLAAASGTTSGPRGRGRVVIAALPGRDVRVRGVRRTLWYPLPRRGVRVVDGAALEKRCAKAPRVRIPPSPPGLIGRAGRRHRRSAFGSDGSGRERSPSGLWR